MMEAFHNYGIPRLRYRTPEQPGGTEKFMRRRSFLKLTVFRELSLGTQPFEDISA